MAASNNYAGTCFGCVIREENTFLTGCAQVTDSSSGMLS